MPRAIVVCLALAVASTPGWCKSMRTYYTESRLATLRDNLARYPWAQQAAQAVVARADKWAVYDDDRLRLLVPPPTVPRCHRVNPMDCPVHGQAILQAPGGYNSWGMDFDHPYKIKCAVGGEEYPSNDFAAYLRSGMKDRSLLVGDYADDGWGWQKAPGDKAKYWFVGYYAGQLVRNYLYPALEDLSQAYLITGQARYAHQCALLLWQLAQYYPDYLYEKQSQYGLEVDHGYNGRLLYHTWETWTVEKASLAYDAVHPALAEDQALQELAGTDAAGLRRDIEERMLRTMARDITDGSHRIAGNYGMHQNALLRVALVLGPEDQGTPSARDLVNWVLNNPAPAQSYQDSAIHDMLVNLIHRDGVPFESPSYNCGWMRDLAEVAEMLQLNGADLWAEPRFRSLYLAPIEALCCGQFSTPLGDSNHLFATPLGTTAPYLQRAYAHLKDPRLAQALVQTGPGFEHDLFTPPVDEEAARQAQQYGRKVGVTSSLLPGLGYLTLQAGGEGHRTGLSLFYGYYVGHSHFDALNVDFYAEGNPLTPDLGYPETADTYDPRRFGFLAHTVVHNTCMVDASRQELGRGRLEAFQPGSFAQWAEVTDVAAYPGKVKDYRRSVFLVEASPEHAYYVDVFRVSGGRQHDLLVHGALSSFDSSLPFTEPRKEGTLAGPDVPYGRFYDQPEFRESRYGLYYYHYRGSAFQWLYDVQEARAAGDEATAPWVRWTLIPSPVAPTYRAQGVALRSHLVPEAETVFACDGTPQRRPQFPEKLKWVIRRRTAATEDLESAFVTVHEAYRDEPFLRGVRRLAVTPAGAGVAVEIDLGDRRQIVFSGRRTDETCTVAGRFTVQGRAACLELGGDGALKRAVLFDGTLLRCGKVTVADRGARQVAVEAVDYAGGVVTLREDCLRREDEGRWVPVTSDTHEASVRIERVLSPRRFSLGQQDLRTGRGYPVAIEGSVIKTNAPLYFVEEGMTVVDERHRPVARVKAAAGSTLTLAGPIRPQDLPDADGDGRGRFLVMALGPGDRATLGSRREWPG